MATKKARMNFRGSIVFFVMGLVIVQLAGCAIDRKYVRLYDGPVLRNEEVALVKPLPPVGIELIDGSKEAAAKAQFGARIVDYDIALKPGMHEFSVSYYDFRNNTKFSSTKNQTIKMELLPNRRYLLSSVSDQPAFYRKDSPYFSWKPLLIDVTEEPARWCIQCEKGTSKPVRPE